MCFQDQISLFAVILSALAAILLLQALITVLTPLSLRQLAWILCLTSTIPIHNKGPDLYSSGQQHQAWVGCIGVVLLFQSSEHMEAAYGLAITVTMLMTSILLYTYSSLLIERVGAIPFIFFGAIEAMFFFPALPSSSTAATLLFFMVSNLCCHVCARRRGTLLREHKALSSLLINAIDQS